MGRNHHVLVGTGQVKEAGRRRGTAQEEAGGEGGAGQAAAGAAEGAGG